MPWIRTVPVEESSGPNGPGLAAVAQLNQALRFESSDLSRVQREMIAAYVSALNDCTF